jgi:hypothetical protein
MLKPNRGLNNYLILVLLTVLLCSGLFLSVDRIRAEELIPAQSQDEEAYLELSVDPVESRAGSLITLNISYVNIGLPHTTILIDPPDLVEFDPPLSMPCRFHEHPSECREITFRTLAPGEVQFNASAHGEIWSDQCQCWFFTTVSDNGPVIAKITEPLKFFIMLVMK